MNTPAAPPPPDVPEAPADTRGAALSDAIESTAFFIYAAIGTSLAALLCCGLAWMLFFVQW